VHTRRSIDRLGSVRPELDTRRESRNRKQSGDGPGDEVRFKSRPNPVPTHGPYPPNRMTWTPPPQGKSNAPTWLKTSLTPLYRLLCGLLVLGVLVLIVMQVFDIPIPFDTPRTFSLFIVAGGVLVLTHALRTWFLRLPIPTRYSQPVPYGYPGWRGFLQAQFATGCFLFFFGALLLLL